MENKVNIAEILKDCPSGMKLNCLMYEDVYFDYVKHNIIHCYIQLETHKSFLMFNQHGTTNSNIKSKCVIFPPGKTTWDGFVPPCKFKDGDIISNGRCICIYNGNNDNNYYGFYVGLGNIDFPNYFIDTPQNSYFTKEDTHLATEEEKKKLFNTIKENGYKWNADTKTLEKIVEPKFKVGDIIQDKYGYRVRLEITEVNIDEEYYGYTSKMLNGICSISFEDQDNWELVPDEIEPKFKVGDRVKRKNVNYTCIVTISEIDGDYYGCVNEDEDEQCSSIYIRTAQDNWELVPDEIEPKFKVGDVVQDKDGYKVEITEVNIGDECYGYISKIAKGIGSISFKDQDDWELVPDKIEPKFKVGDEVVRKDGVCAPVLIVRVGKEFYYSDKGYTVEFFTIKDQDNWELVPDEIEPKFNIGDRVKHKQSFISGTITNIDDDCYKIKYDSGAVSFAIINDQDDWELVSDEIEPKFKVGDKIRLKGNPNYIYTITGIKENKSGCGVTFDLRFSEQDKNGNWFPKFDISTLVPFESKVLVRDSRDDMWRPAIFGCFNGKTSPYYVLGGIGWKYCIPYEGNENLCGKKDDCKEYYKTW